VKLPRGISGDRLIRALKSLGYEVIRKKGSHVRLRHPAAPVHMITVPDHDALKTGTLHGILSDVSQARGVSIDFLIERL
jgi:predicted RNA binding protein YcfA (HicA-like mRNA interferase family)